MAQPYKGARVPHTVRVPADLHRATVAAGRHRRWSFNDVVVEALKEWIDARSERPVPSPVGVRHNQNVYDDEGNKVGVA